MCVCLFNNLFRAPNHCALDLDMISLRWIRKALHTAASDSFDMYFVLVDAEYLVTIVGGCSTWESHAVQSNMRMDIRFHYVQEEFKVAYTNRLQKDIFLQKKPIHKLMVYLGRGSEFACIMPKGLPVHFWFWPFHTDACVSYFCISVCESRAACLACVSCWDCGISRA